MSRSFWAVCCCAGGSEGAGPPQTSTACFLIMKQRSSVSLIHSTDSNDILKVTVSSFLPFNILRSVDSSVTHLSTSGFAALSLWDGCMKKKKLDKQQCRYYFQIKYSFAVSTKSHFETPRLPQPTLYFLSSSNFSSNLWIFFFRT